MRSLGAAVFLLLLSICTAVTATAEPLAPRTITARDRTGAIILWDATPYVERLAAGGTSTPDAIRALEAEAVTLFVQNAAPLARRERHLRVVVSYVQTGAIDPRYQTKTVGGIHTILTVEGKISPEMRFPKNWEAQARRGVLPRGLKVEIARDLPASVER